VIDANGFGLWQEITRVRAGKYSVQYPEYPEDPEDDQEVQDTAPVLADMRANCRIFRTQETQRQAALSSDASESSPASSDDSSSDAEAYTGGTQGASGLREAARGRVR
jgi:hypothetical protein